MSKSNKIIIIVVAVTVAVCAALAGVFSLYKSKNNDSQTTAVSSDVASSSVSGVQGSTDGSTVAPQTSAPVSQTLAQAIIGKWSDSSGMSGYEFFADGTVEVTYVNLTVPVINLPINGTSKGSYTIDGDKVTTKFSIYSKTITDVFVAKVENNSLTLYDTEELETKTYSRDSATTTTSAVTTSQPSVSTKDDIIGSWINSDSSKKLQFESDGKVIVSFAQNGAFSSTFTGVYLTQDDSIIMQYTKDNQQITERYIFSVSKNSMSLTDESGTVTLFAREGTDMAGTASTNEDLMGKWTDGSEMSGYEFKHDGIVVLTYVNFTVPVVNMPINGTYTGTYTISGNEITISYSIYAKTIVNTYTFAVSGNTLTLTNTKDGEVSTYYKK